MTSGCIAKLVKADHFGFEKNNNNKNLRRTGFLCGPKPNARKVKYLDPAFVKGYNPLKPKVTISRRKPSNDFKNEEVNFSVKKTPVQSVIPSKRPIDDVNDCKFDYGEQVKVTPNVVTENKVKRLEPKELGTKSYLDKKTAKVKHWDGVRNRIDTTIIGSSKEIAKREKINEAMSNFIEVYERLDEQNRLKPVIEKISTSRILEEVEKIVTRKLNWMEPEKVLGPVCGVRVGDKFRFRFQLQMIGLHCQRQSGIDYKKIEGKNLAISIVDSHRYSNERKDFDTLNYCGHGGHGVMGGKQQIEDQKLERGNLALKNSKDEQNEVRVIRKIEEAGRNHVYLYDGLYTVSKFTRERSKEVFGCSKYKDYPDLTVLMGQMPDMF
ncbi:YDG domain-containing protein At5g47150-like [Rutidosis leptorrhynchoides]|uniref:YDG domain-containing protein At5g47150-like n=1 Tax=Rutidosis leptorrhynchoides TaxID=125765 RepID=UPI003A9995FD